MHTREAFMASIDLDPGDWVTRDVFVDWLEEQGAEEAWGWRLLNQAQRVPHKYPDGDWGWWNTSSDTDQANLGDYEALVDEAVRERTKPQPELSSAAAPWTPSLDRGHPWSSSAFLVLEAAAEVLARARPTGDESSAWPNRKRQGAPDSGGSAEGTAAAGDAADWSYSSPEVSTSPESDGLSEGVWSDARGEDAGDEPTTWSDEAPAPPPAPPAPSD